MIISAYDFNRGVLYGNKYLFKNTTPEDFRGLTPLFYNHVNPYRTFKLNMDQ